MSQSEYIAEAYARGRVTFMGLELLVAPGALVPRPETELLGCAALAGLEHVGNKPWRIVDMCCGSGNLACALAHLLPGACVWAADLTPECVQLARRNVALCDLGERVLVRQGDLFAALEGLGLEGTIDAVVCNPPYISDGRLATDRAHLLELEPREAFSGGPYGLSVHMRVVREALAFLRPGAMLLFEVGAGQDRQVKMLFERARAYDDICIAHDEAGEGRVVSAVRRA